VSPSSAISSSPTSTPLVYCVPYPSSTPTAFETPTSTPLVMITPWPLQQNGSVSPSTSPLFMMIPYPSSSPLPFNVTAAATAPIDVTPMVVTGVAVGALGVGSVLFLLQYLKKAPKPTIKAEEKREEEKDKQEKGEVEVHMPDALTYLCINTADLEDVTFLLNLFRKQFRLVPVNVTASPIR
jgi:hypothetical protein